MRHPFKEGMCHSFREGIRRDMSAMNSFCTNPTNHTTTLTSTMTELRPQPSLAGRPAISPLATITAVAVTSNAARTTNRKLLATMKAPETVTLTAARTINRNVPTLLRTRAAGVNRFRFDPFAPGLAR
jgi:hypothetical protein